MEISECLIINLRTEQMIQKELNESNSDYKGTAAWEPLSDHSRKGIHKCVPECQVMIDNNPSESIRSKVRDMGKSEFLIKQVMHQDIQYFSYRMRKG